MALVMHGLLPRLRSILPQGLLVLLCLQFAAHVHGQGIDTVIAQGRPLTERFTHTTLAVHTAGQRVERFQVFLALDPAQRARGLMYVEAMPDDAGMLFRYEREHVVRMWMKNTPLPLDMLFLDRRGRIVNIVSGTIPYSLGSISSVEPAIGVLELNTGTAERLEIRVGDFVVHQLFSGP